MNDIAAQVIIARIKMVQAWILQATEKLSEEDLSQPLGTTAPPIGWHLWHIARWTDRVQASLPRPHTEVDAKNYQPNPNRGVWEQRQLADQWDLDRSRLGTLEEGSGMDFATAAMLPQKIGKDALLAYVHEVFDRTNQTLDSLKPDQFAERRSSVMEYAYNVADGTIWKAQGAETTLAADLGFHLSHANRHLGMIEALSGLLERKGTVTV